MYMKTLIFLIPLNMASANLSGMILAYPNCDFIVSVAAGESFEITNPEWPAEYESDQLCRWVLTCPIGYRCRLKCNYVSMPLSHDCDTDKLMVSDIGDMLLFGAHIFCGRSVINIRSQGPRLTMGLISSPESTGGRFRCLVIPEVSY